MKCPARTITVFFSATFWVITLFLSGARSTNESTYEKNNERFKYKIHP